jgi:hypothetical protein
MKRFRVEKKKPSVLVLHFTTVLCLLILGGLQVAQAQSSTFAQFQQRNAQVQGFIFSNNTENATLQTNTAGTGLPISFRYSVPGINPALAVFQDATLYMLAVTNTPAEPGAPPNGIRQNFQTVTIQIFRDATNPPAPAGSCINSCTNLLTATVTTGFPGLNGDLGDSAASFLASTPSENVTFTSDFLIFTGTSQRNFGLSFSSVTPALAIGASGFLRSFTAAGTGTFASTPAPCPVSVCGPTPAPVFVSGRVLTPNGRGLSNAFVNLTESDGTVHTVRTSAFGYYRFRDLTAGQSVTLSVSSKRYSFAPRIINLNEEIEDLNLVSQY